MSALLCSLSLVREGGGGAPSSVWARSPHCSFAQRRALARLRCALVAQAAANRQEAHRFFVLDVDAAPGLGPWREPLCAYVLLPAAAAVEGSDAAIAAVALTTRLYSASSALRVLTEALALATAGRPTAAASAALCALADARAHDHVREMESALAATRLSLLDSVRALAERGSTLAALDAKSSAMRASSALLAADAAARNRGCLARHLRAAAAACAATMCCTSRSETASALASSVSSTIESWFGAFFSRTPSSRHVPLAVS